MLLADCLVVSAMLVTWTVPVTFIIALLSRDNENCRMLGLVE